MNALTEKPEGNNKISERIRSLRTQTGVSQKEFAESINLHPVQYNRYENGETLPSTESLAKIADALAVSVDYLYEGEAENAFSVNLKDRSLLKMFIEMEKLSYAQKETIKDLIDAYLKRNKFEQLSNSKLV